MISTPIPLSKNQIQESLEMGVGYLLRQQRSDGAFNYEYNWQDKTNSTDDNPVRQAGVLWGLALAHQHKNNPMAHAACSRGLEFFERHSTLTSTGGRFVRYPGATHGYMGTVALLALVIIELLRSPPPLDAVTSQHWRATLDGYIRFLLDGQDQRGLWYGRYDHCNGIAYGEPSAFFDGEALLALVKAAKFLGYGHLYDRVMRAAATGYRHNILLPLNNGEKRRTIARGYYQWGMMSFCELIDSSWPDVEQYIESVFFLGDMRTGSRASKNNQGAVLEGLIYAYAIATERDAQRAKNYRSFIIRDLSRMMSLQVRNPAALEFLSGSETDALAVGGFQHYPDQPTLRIDFTQHAIHALLLSIKQVRLFD